MLRGPAAAINKAFAVQLRDYQYSGGKYRSHDGPSSLPSALANVVEAVVGLTDRKVPAKHFAARRKRGAADPPDTQPLNPQEVAALYEFPAGDGGGQTIGLYEMETEGPAGYSIDDIRDSLQAFGGGLKVPTLIDVSIDGVRNSGRSDGETGLDITVASAIAPGAKIAVYFTGGTVQAIMMGAGPQRLRAADRIIGHGGTEEAGKHRRQDLRHLSVLHHAQQRLCVLGRRC